MTNTIESRQAERPQSWVQPVKAFTRRVATELDAANRHICPWAAAPPAAEGLMSAEGLPAERIMVRLDVGHRSADLEPVDPHLAIATADGLSTLEFDWDLAQSPEIGPQAISFVTRLLKDTRSPWMPDVLPNTSGGVRLEWFVDDDHFMIMDFEPDGQVDLSYAGGGPMQVWEDGAELPADLSTLLLRVYETN